MDMRQKLLSVKGDSSASSKNDNSSVALGLGFVTSLCLLLLPSHYRQICRITFKLILKPRPFMFQRWNRMKTNYGILLLMCEPYYVSPISRSVVHAFKIYPNPPPPKKIFWLFNLAMSPYMYAKFVLQNWKKLAIFTPPHPLVFV